MTLKATIERLAHELAEGVLTAIRRASLAELVGGDAGPSSAQPAAAPTSTKPRGGRRGRRSGAEIGAVVDKLVAELKKSAKSGLRSEQLQKALGLDKKAVFLALTQALAAKQIRKTGQKRATTYYPK